MPSDPVRVLLRVAEILDDLGTPWFVGGSLASSIVGEPRSTVDVDVVVLLRSADTSRLVAALAPEFYVDARAADEATVHRASFNAIHQPTILKVDFFVLGDAPFDREQLARRVPIDLGGEPERRVYVSSAEDMVLRKLDWYRSGGSVSDRQWRDVLGILKVQGDRLDFGYLRRWARDLALAPLLDRALADAGLSSK